MSEPSKTQARTVIPAEARPDRKTPGRLLRQLLARLSREGVRQADTPADRLPDLGFTPKEGRYRDPVKITRGGMATVFRVEDRDLARPTAAKVALPAIARDPANAARFVEEARITARLEHPNIVPVHDMGQTHDLGLFFTMKLVQGEALSDILERLRLDDRATRETYSLHTLLAILRKACDAIAFAHSRDVVHLDIKPENIMVGPYGEVLVLDWGIARQLPGNPGAPPPPTAPRDIRGTPAYMAPEQAEGHAGQLDRQTDVFLIGATLYHILTLAPPYAAEDPEAALALAAAGRLAAPESLHECADVPEELRRITLKALAARKDQRYASVTELAADIDSVLSGRVLSVRRRFAAGESLMRAGEPGQEAYVIMCGRVEVVQDSAGGTVRLGILGPGDIVGEIAIITHKERSATVTALEDTEALVITEALMQDALRKTPPWLGKTVTALARRLREIDRLVHPLLAGASPYHVLGQLSLLLPPRTPDPAGTTLDWASTAATIGLNLGVSPAHVEPVLCALADSGLASCQPDGRLLVADRARLERFVEFCRHVLTGDDLAGLPDHERAEFERIHDTLARQGAGRTPSAAS